MVHGVRWFFQTRGLNIHSSKKSQIEKLLVMIKTGTLETIKHVLAFLFELFEKNGF